MKTIMEWCISCRFEKTKDGKYYVVRKEAPEKKHLIPML